MTLKSERIPPSRETSDIPSNAPKGWFETIIKAPDGRFSTISALFTFRSILKL